MSFDTFKTMKETYAESDHTLMDKLVKDALEPRPMVAYCDYIAYQIQKNLKALDAVHDKLLASVSNMKFDATDDGKFLSTKKTIMVEDRYGKKYKITVEEA
jgi:hypothetical protein